MPESAHVMSHDDCAIPIEYRYRTGMAGALAGGAATLLVALALSHGVAALALVAVAVVGIGYGALGLVADARGVVRAAGRRLVVTDDALQEVDERGRVLWMLRPTEIDFVRPETGPRVFPWSGSNGLRVENWLFVLKDGDQHVVPVWLLPDRGRRFKQRYESFIGFARRSSRKIGS